MESSAAAKARSTTSSSLYQRRWRATSPSAVGLAIQVDDSRAAYNRAFKFGAQPIEVAPGAIGPRLPAIKRVGGVPIPLIDGFDESKSI